MKEIKYCIYKYIEENFLPLFFVILGLTPIYLIAIVSIGEIFSIDTGSLKFLAVLFLPSLVILLALTSFFCTHSTSYIASMIEMAEHNKRKLEAKYAAMEKTIDSLSISDSKKFLLKDKFLDKLSKTIRATNEYIDEHKLKLEFIKVKKEIRHKMQEES